MNEGVVASGFSLPLALFLLISMAVCTPGWTADLDGKPTLASKSTKASFSPSETTATSTHRRASDEINALVFTSAPRESLEDGQKIYGPVAQYLSKALGRKVVYRHPGTWGAYRSEMLRGDYDIVFDGPHLNSYRAERLHHHILAKAPGIRDFAVITKKDSSYTSLAQLGGRTICTHAPPNLGTLILLSEFSNPARQPAIIPTEGWDRIYHAVNDGRCIAGVIPSATLKKIDSAGTMKIVFKSRPLPDQAFSAGPRLSPEEQAKLAAALISPEADTALAKMRAAHKIGGRFEAASNSEYLGVSQYLRSEFGYY